MTKHEAWLAGLQPGARVAVVSHYGQPRRTGEVLERLPGGQLVVQHGHARWHFGRDGQERACGITHAELCPVALEETP